MGEATKLCNHVALLHEGRIVEYGNPLQICRKYNHQNRIKILLKSGEIVILDNNRSAAQRMNDYVNHEMIEAIHSTEPNLETVFMELTGKELAK
jgi:ABC-2 type transport system ATP-binding protein